TPGLTSNLFFQKPGRFPDSTTNQTKEHKMTSRVGNETESDRVLTFTREFKAPRDNLWKAWTDSEHIAKWFGPEGFSTKVSDLDLTPGGRWRYIMIGPDGTEYPSKGIFQEIVPGERIVTTDEFDEGFEKVSQA